MFCRYFQTDVKVGSHIARMRINPFEKCQVATGGNENVLKLWDLNRPEKPLFKAKNVKHNSLILSTFVQFIHISMITILIFVPIEIVDFQVDCQIFEFCF